MLTLIDILKAKALLQENYKIHLATGKNPTPQEAFLEGHFKEWQEEQNSKNFQCEYILSLIGLDNDKWLFAGIYKVLGVTRGTKTPYLYQTELVPGQDDLVGRIVVRYKCPSRASYIWGHKYGKYLDIFEMRSTRLSIGDFPGYNNVILSYRKLRIIVSQQEPSWRSALSNVKGAYLITDTSTGKAYVGSATGEGGIWQRWESYAATGHGGNAELKDLLKTKGIEHADNFQYAICQQVALSTHLRYDITDSSKAKEGIV